MNLMWCISALLIGLLVGIISGLTPGIHINVVASLMVAFYTSASLSKEWSLPICLFIVSVSITHAFFDYLPSLFLGVPTDEVYALLPGQRLIKEGKGGEALKLSIEGSWRGLSTSLIIASICIVLTMIGINPLHWAEDILKPFLFWVLMSVSVILIVTENNSRLWAITLFLLSGLFGIVILGSPLVPGGSSAAFSVLFPALSGIFGISGLLQALSEDTAKLPNQSEDITLNISESEIKKASLIGTLSGMAVGLLPGLGAANAATLTMLLNGGDQNQDKDSNGRRYIVSTSAIQASDAVFGIASLYLIEKSRSGASVAISSIIGEINVWQILIILVGMGITGFLSSKLLLKSWTLFIYFVNFVIYRALTLAVIVFITSLVVMTTGFWGFLVLLGGTCLGLLPAIVKVRRSQLMGLFLVPVMLFFSGFQDSFVTLFGLQAQISPSSPITLNQIFLFLIISSVAALTIYLIKNIRN